MLWLYDWSQVVYTVLFKRHKEAWGISKEEFLAYPAGTLGHAVGNFYHEKGFSVMPKLENHDAFHVITGTGTEIQDEIAMQYLLLGNGKLSLYMFAMIFIGTALYPEFLVHYLISFRKGKHMQVFHDVEFKELLDSDLNAVQAAINSPKFYLNQIFN